MKKSFEELLENIKNNTSSDFNNLYEKAKEEQKKSNKYFLILALIIDAFIIYKFCSNVPAQPFRLAFIMPLIVIIFIADIFLYLLVTLPFSKNRKLYKKAFKENIIQKLLCNFYNDVDYIPNKEMPSHIYDAGKYGEYYDDYDSDDYMEGLLNNKYHLRMAEVHTTKEETYTDSDGDTHTRTVTIFHGLFAQIKMEKSINSNLSIMENHIFAKKNKLNMDSQEFEKLFDVTATNQIIGMQLLTHDIMELLVSFKKSTGINYDISIYDDIIYLRFHTGAMFEFGSFKKGAFDEPLLRKYYNVLDFTYTLSKMLIELIDKTEI